MYCYSSVDNYLDQFWRFFSVSRKCFFSILSCPSDITYTFNSFHSLSIKTKMLENGRTASKNMSWQCSFFTFHNFRYYPERIITTALTLEIILDVIKKIQFRWFFLYRRDVFILNCHFDIARIFLFQFIKMLSIEMLSKHIQNKCWRWKEFKWLQEDFAEIAWYKRVVDETKTFSLKIRLTIESFTYFWWGYKIWISFKRIFVGNPKQNENVSKCIFYFWIGHRSFLVENLHFVNFCPLNSFCIEAGFVRCFNRINCRCNGWLWWLWLCL